MPWLSTLGRALNPASYTTFFSYAKYASGSFLPWKIGIFIFILLRLLSCLPSVWTLSFIDSSAHLPFRTSPGAFWWLLFVAPVIWLYSILPNWVWTSWWLVNNCAIWSCIALMKSFKSGCLSTPLEPIIMNKEQKKTSQITLPHVFTLKRCHSILVFHSIRFLPSNDLTTHLLPLYNSFF